MSTLVTNDFQSPIQKEEKMDVEAFTQEAQKISGLFPM